MIPALLHKAFRDRFGTGPQFYRAPGRVNLIGEHTDYNDGFVMPVAVGFSTWAAVAPRPGRNLVVHSENFGETCDLDLDYSAPKRRGHWSDYVLGVAVILEREGLRLGGANLLIASDVPVGAGLSSSAALEVAVALALTPEPIERTALAKLCQRAEHEFAGVKCGIMDQFSACHARAGQALLLDCRSLEYSFAPLPAQARLVIANTMVRHELAGPQRVGRGPGYDEATTRAGRDQAPFGGPFGTSEYSRRRAECAEAAAYFGKNLRDVTFEELRHVSLPDALFRRARHVVTENARVLEARAALDRGDLQAFGALMYASHRSLREDYEVSCAELDQLVEIARGVPGVHGSRMTGGGFGGCTVSLVAEGSVEVLRAALAAGYPRGEVYVSDAAAAAGPC